MPNWKSYESSVRLLSAIIAAHPGLKLNYDDVARYYGDGAKYKSVWDRMNIINKNAKAIAAAVDAGQDPFAVPLDDTQTAAKSNKAQDISARFGGDCTKSAIENRFRRLKSDAKLINDAVKNGIDPITLNVGDTDGMVAISGAVLAKYFGSDVTPNAIQLQINRNVQPTAKKVREYADGGGDPKDLNIGGDGDGKGGKQIAAWFGSDATVGGIKFQFSTTIKKNLDALRDGRARGLDCKDITLPSLAGLGGQEMAAIMGSDVTPHGLRFQFTDRIKPIGKKLQEMRSAGLDPKDIDLDSLYSAKGGGKTGRSQIHSLLISFPCTTQTTLTQVVF
ncbi:hypothetical protein DL98DRAFT_422919 [Cadophora sp. DSE1049]|nr:hypothetical protein DL98DRAFT_422919 [Cadophora sp. DSE1049]